MNNLYQPPNRAVWTGRATNNKRDYWYQVIEMLDLNQGDLAGVDIALIGYQCEEGIRLNQGRLGAQEGPKVIRKFLSRLPVHHDQTVIADAGDMVFNDTITLEKFQEAFAQQVKRLLEARIMPVGLGGGHDISYAHFTGIHQALKEKGKRFGIINFDAHFDLRKENHSTSGTPFYQILQEFDNVDYLALGIQESANTQELFAVAEQTDSKFLLLEFCNRENIQESLDLVKGLASKVDYLYVTLDMDGFSSAYAPGVSAPSPLGLTPEYVVAVLKAVFDSGKVVAVDLAETNPKYDIDHHTARLAAKLVWQVVKAIDNPVQC